MCRSRSVALLVRLPAVRIFRFQLPFAGKLRPRAIPFRPQHWHGVVARGIIHGYTRRRCYAITTVPFCGWHFWIRIAEDILLDKWPFKDIFIPDSSSIIACACVCLCGKMFLRMCDLAISAQPNIWLPWIDVFLAACSLLPAPSRSPAHYIIAYLFGWWSIIGGPSRRSCGRIKFVKILPMRDRIESIKHVCVCSMVMWVVTAIFVQRKLARYLRPKLDAFGCLFVANIRIWPLPAHTSHSIEWSGLVFALA